MANIKEITDYCTEYLQPDLFKDYCPNGLQIEGTEEIKRIVAGVTACQDLIDAAIDFNADLLLVHHGFFWKNESPVLTGIKQRRIKALLSNNINLLAYHLPLDAHPEVGNNHRFANTLKLKKRFAFGPNKLALGGKIKPHSGAELAKKLAVILERQPLHIAAERPIESVGLCTGAAQGMIEEAIECNLDAFISGEVSESTVHIARENNIHYFAAGHHATERFGARALGKHLAEKFSLKFQFVDINNPV